MTILCITIYARQSKCGKVMRDLWILMAIVQYTRIVYLIPIGRNIDSTEYPKRKLLFRNIDAAAAYQL